MINNWSSQMLIQEKNGELSFGIGYRWGETEISRGNYVMLFIDMFIWRFQISLVRLL